MSNDNKGSQLVRFFAEQIDWDKSDRQRLRETAKVWKALTLFSRS